jgi:hypothetical protein
MLCIPQGGHLFNGLDRFIHLAVDAEEHLKDKLCCLRVVKEGRSPRNEVINSLRIPAHMTAADIDSALGKLYKAIAQTASRRAMPPTWPSSANSCSSPSTNSRVSSNSAMSMTSGQKMYLDSKPLSNPPCVTPGEPQAANSAAVVHTGGGTAVGPGKDNAGGPA